MADLQTGVGLLLAYKKETTYGTLPTNDSSAKYLRRLKFGISMKKDSIKSAEIRTDYQRPSSRHAMRKVDGNIECELSLGSYADFIGSTLRRDFAAVSSLGALTNVTAAATAPHFVRASGSWISDGLRVGMTVRMTGWTTTATANNSKNFTIVALTATNMTVMEVVAAKASGDSVVVSIPGKVTYIPTTGHTNDSYAFEEWAPSAVQSLRFLGVKIGGFDIKLPPNDKATLTLMAMGQDRTDSTTQYFTSASAASTTQMQTGLSGRVIVNGVQYGVVTDFSLSVNGNLSTRGVVGSNITPDVFRRAIDVSGSISVLWDDSAFDDLFDSETKAPMIVQLFDSSGSASDFMNICLPNTLFSGGDMPDDEGEIVQTLNFEASIGALTGYETTSVWIQDSLA